MSQFSTYSTHSTGATVGIGQPEPTTSLHISETTETHILVNADATWMRLVVNETDATKLLTR